MAKRHFYPFCQHYNQATAVFSIAKTVKETSCKTCLQEIAKCSAWSNFRTKAKRKLHRMAWLRLRKWIKS